MTRACSFRRPWKSALKGEGEDALLIHYVTKKFLYSNKRWDLSESQSFRIGSAAES